MITGLKTLSSKWPVAPPKVDRHVVADDLRADHRQRLALRRVDLAGHDRAAGLVLGQPELAEAAARAGAEEPDVVRDLDQADRQHVERAGQLDHRVVRGERLEFVLRGDERQAGDLCDLLRELLGEARRAFRPVPTAVPPCASS